MKILKTHLKLKGKAICGARKQKRKLEFAASQSEVTCGNCLKAIER